MSDEAEVTYRDVQRVAGVLLLEVHAVPMVHLPDLNEALPVALELVYTALCMKPAYSRGGLKVAQRYCGLVGQDFDQIFAFACARVRQAIQDQES